MGAFYKWDNWGNDRWRNILKDTQLVCDWDSIQIGLFEATAHAPSIMTKSFWLIQKYTVSGFRHQNYGRLLNLILSVEGMFLWMVYGRIEVRLKGACGHNWTLTTSHWLTMCKTDTELSTGSSPQFYEIASECYFHFKDDKMEQVAMLAFQVKKWNDS